MSKNPAVFLLITLILLLGCSSASAAPAAKIVGGVVTNVASALFKWLWSLKSTTTTKPAVSTRSMMKFESGYTVETVFDGSKLGIEPHSVEVSPAGEVLILDYENSNIYKTSMPLSRYSRPKLVAGSTEGYSGHVDGKLRDARMNHPKGLAVDDGGNIYVADTMNMAIRKISDTGVVTIAGGGKWARGGGHIDGPSEDAKFSNDFDVVYVGSSCSLLVIDRGNQAIREIQLHEDDCPSYQDDDNNIHLGTALLVAAGFFGYMLALLQRRIGAMFSSDRDPRAPTRGMPPTPYQLNATPVRPPLIPPEDEYEKPEENVFVSIGRLFANTSSSVFEIFGGLFSGFRKKPYPHHHLQHHNYPYPHKQPNPWSMQESYVIPREDEPPPLEPRDPAPRKPYPYVSKDLERTRHFKQSRSNNYGGWTGEFQQPPPQLQQLHHQKHHSPSPQTFIEQSCETTNEIVFGAVQEQDGRREAVVIKAVDYADPAYNHYNIRSRYNYNTTYSHGY
ncbi:PREDICTED: uncharacterized protein LOC109178012 [Ipomoea nil]|uniref:uncharacterized protein LOC109178012 n=1 Tax=Ipomoea nil TaxID=35883 RepID=UPI000901F132|nr:PREDICTED: uncharacterized protein LOC109178012 [Ipomoea nil]